MHDRSGSVPATAAALLGWWETTGRRDQALKPWMFTCAGHWPTAAEDLDPYGIWIAEVMFQQPSWLHDQVSLGHGGATSWRG